MQKKIKLNLDDIKVQSFVTSLEKVGNDETNKIFGGTGITPHCGGCGTATGTCTMCYSCATESNGPQDPYGYTGPYYCGDKTYVPLCC